MKHITYIKVRDLIIGAFIVQINMRINQVFYPLLTLYLTYTDYTYNAWLRDLLQEHPVVVYLGTFLNFVVYALLICLFIMVLSIIQALISMSKKGVLGKHTFELTDEGLRESTEYNNSFFSYDAIVRVVVVLKNVYIQVANEWYFLPGRDFESKEAKKSFVDFIKSKKDAYKQG